MWFNYTLAFWFAVLKSSLQWRLSCILSVSPLPSLHHDIVSHTECLALDASRCVMLLNSITLRCQHYYYCWCWSMTMLVGFHKRTGNSNERTRRLSSRIRLSLSSVSCSIIILCLFYLLFHFYCFFHFYSLLPTSNRKNMIRMRFSCTDYWLLYCTTVPAYRWLASGYCFSLGSGLFFCVFSSYVLGIKKYDWLETRLEGGQK